MFLEGEFGNLCHRSIGRMPSDRKLALPQRKPCDPDACPPLRSLWTASSQTGQTGTPHRSDGYPPVRSVRPTGQTGLMLLHFRLRFFSLGFVDQPRNPVVFW
jgi:hypothetical protein